MQISTQSTPTGVLLLDLPSEIHMQITSFLSYPDALALKHTSRYFYDMVYTGVHLKVEWLVERFERKLECPMEKCSFRTDESFCNERVRQIMERRRWHLECRRVPGGCWVVEGQTCRTDLVPSWLKRARTRKRIEYVGLLMREAVIVVILAFLIKVSWVLLRRSYNGVPNFAVTF
ncbi:hypothetical protein N7520_010000 [Penicillium odoratum]|uniref:uncharacterized protein n=1 Tax=Penicillium odoratum TaxID=1167516 RepID=UPI002548E763|nr:uncharacterized protein N7520_010000 [Penicillium odoratum]KAJ5753083.1 hypothetical protein N7520_010000 [Penicillium odoratum]